MAGSIFRGKVKNNPIVVAAFNPKEQSSPVIMVDGAPLPRGPFFY